LIEESAFEELYQATAQGLRTYLYRVCGERRIVEDLVQEAYYRFLRSGFSGESREHSTRYLYRIATNLLKDHWSDRKRSPELPDEEPPERPSHDPPQERIDVHSALGGLGRRDREMLWLAYAEGYSHDEIAGILGLKAKSVRVLLFRAKNRLLRVLKESS
jgi:RNA polymerase sigma-70 factor (ECF subfamily)